LTEKIIGENEDHHQKVTNLNQMILDLRQHAKHAEYEGAEMLGYKDKLATACMTIHEVKSRLKISEENSEKKDQLIKDWASTLDKLKDKIDRVEEENRVFLQERELVKGALNHVKNFVIYFS
jgi:chromosome segregation ATPase